MTFISEKLVQINNVVLSWDGLRNPETRQSGSINYNLGFLMSLAAIEYAELKSIVDNKLQTGIFRGAFPANGNHPLEGTTAKPKVPQPEKFGPEYANHISLSAGTTRGIPPIIDANLQPMQPMVFSPMLYPGCIVNVLVDCWDYDNINKGISLGLQGIQIVDSTAPALPVGAGMSSGDVAAAFGKPALAGAPAAPAPAPAPGSGPAAPAAPTGPVMLPAAGGHSYESYLGAGWDDAKLIAAGFMTA